MHNKIFLEGHAKFEGKYVQPVHCSISSHVHSRPTSGEQKLTSLSNTQLNQSDPAYCSIAVASYVAPYDGTNANGKFKVDHKAEPGTAGFAAADRIYQDLFAHIMLVSSVEIQQIYLTMAESSQAELSWVLRKFYMVNHTRTAVDFISRMI